MRAALHQRFSSRLRSVGKNNRATDLKFRKKKKKNRADVIEFRLISLSDAFFAVFPSFFDSSRSTEAGILATLE